MPVNLNFAYTQSEEVLTTIQDMMEYHPWSEDKKIRGNRIREVLTNALAVIIEVIPPCPDRTVAIRKIREARMDCNSALTHNGKY